MLAFLTILYEILQFSLDEGPPQYLQAFLIRHLGWKLILIDVVWTLMDDVVKLATDYFGYSIGCLAGSLPRFQGVVHLEALIERISK